MSIAYSIYKVTPCLLHIFFHIDFPTYSSIGWSSTSVSSIKSQVHLPQGNFLSQNLLRTVSLAISELQWSHTSGTACLKMRRLKRSRRKEMLREELGMSLILWYQWWEVHLFDELWTWLTHDYAGLQWTWRDWDGAYQKAHYTSCSSIYLCSTDGLSLSVSISFFLSQPWALLMCIQTI